MTTSDAVSAYLVQLQKVTDSGWRRQLGLATFEESRSSAVAIVIVGLQHIRYSHRTITIRSMQTFSQLTAWPRFSWVTLMKKEIASSLGSIAIAGDQS